MLNFNFIMDEAIRIAAFDWLGHMTMLHGDVLPREMLVNDFIWKEDRIILLGAKGIWKPRQMDLPISITTTWNSPYNDVLTEDRFVKYKYRGNNPYHTDNVGLRNLMIQQIPLIYFLGVAPGKYLCEWPVFIQDDDMENLVFTVAVDDKSILKTGDNPDVASDPTASYIRRSYLTSAVLQRRHQRSFREKVLMAYGYMCSLCRLRHIELLDAAHIIPDSDEKGDPIVSNGLSMCKIHHAVFDKNILGITPDYIIKVRDDVLNEKDGDMLKYGLQSLEKHKIILPYRHADWPDRDRLAIRYEHFLKAV